MACEICHEIYTPNTINQSDTDVKPHLCTTCGQSFSLKIQLKRHTLLHGDGAPYTCINCVKTNDTTEKTYNLRLGNSNEYSCALCEKSFSNKRLLLRHSIQHTFDGISDTEEGTEDKTFKISNVNHKRKYSRKNDKKESFKCKNCDKSFLSLVSLEKHSLTHDVTKSGKLLSCKTCDKAFAYQACLDKHISRGKCKNLPVDVKDKSSSSDCKKHTCSICGKNFARKSSLEGHELSHILEDKVTTDDEKACSDGEESDEYISQPTKKQRSSKSSVQKTFSCDKCNFVCFSKLTSNKHAAYHIESDNTLPDVERKDESFVNEKISVASENKEHKIDKNIYAYKKFETEELFDKHNLVHVKKEKESRVENVSASFPCEICDKKFYSKKDLKRHLLFHVEMSPENSSSTNSKWGKERQQRCKNFVCEICGRRFAGETCLKKHAVKHEGEEPTEPKQPSIKVKKPKIVKELICQYCNEDFTGKRSAYMKHIHAHTPEVCGICDERFVDRESLREHCKIHVGTEEGRMFMQCSQKALDAKNGLTPPEPKVEYIYLVLR